VFLSTSDCVTCMCNIRHLCVCGMFLDIYIYWVCYLSAVVHSQLHFAYCILPGLLLPIANSLLQLPIQHVVYIDYCLHAAYFVNMHVLYIYMHIYIYVYLSPSIYFLCLNHCPWSICTFGSINVDVVSHRHRNCACLVTVRIPTVTVAAMSEQHRGRGNGRASRATGPPLRVEGHHL